MHGRTQDTYIHRTQGTTQVSLNLSGRCFAIIHVYIQFVCISLPFLNRHLKLQILLPKKGKMRGQMERNFLWFYPFKINSIQVHNWAITNLQQIESTIFDLFAFHSSLLPSHVQDRKWAQKKKEKKKKSTDIQTDYWYKEEN